MQRSYDYTILIQELKEELSDGVLSLTDTIQVLRHKDELIPGYRPILDWYYNDAKMREDLEPDIFDDEKEAESKRRIRAQYFKDQLELLEITVADCISEMEKWNKII